MVDGGVGADDHDHVRLIRIRERIRDRAGADALQQGDDGRGVAEPRAVVNVVVAESGAHQLLEQIRLLVAALRTAKTCECRGAVILPDALESVGSRVQCLLPSRRPEDLLEIAGVEKLHRFRHPFAPDQRLGEAFRMVDVIEAEAPLHAESALVRRTLAALHAQDAVLLDVVGEQAPHPAVRTGGLDLLVRNLQPHVFRRHQRPRRAGLHALPAGHAGAGSHLVVEVKDDGGVVAAIRVADHVVDLHLAAGPHAACALDAGVELHSHRRVRHVLLRLVPPLKPGLRDSELFRPNVQFGALCVGRFSLLRHVREQQFHHHLLRVPGSFALAAHLHALRGVAAAGGGQHALAVNFNDTGTAVAVRAVAVLVAEVGDFGPGALGGLQDGLVRKGFDALAVQLKTDDFSREGVHVS